MPESYESIIDAHLSTWNSAPGPEREQAIVSIYSLDVAIGEPGAAYTGHAGMTEAISGLQTQLPGTVITRSSPIQTAQDLVTYSWSLGPAGGTAIVTGRDILIIREGSITSVYVLIDAT
ncbi:MAG: hypothetical protein ACTH8F_12110 [Microbacterium sp.]|uniref:hypothetical protein n=1 Tax=Microbacterium sp. TaxID=51671 RepID=UPI003F9553FC